MSMSGEKAGMAGSSSQWFHRNIGRMETEKLLVENRDDGSFLIRKSDNVKGAYVLSTIYQQRIHHYRIIPNEDGVLSVQAQEGVARQPFHSLEDLVEYYSHRGRGLVCPLVRPIPQAKEDEEPLDSDDENEPSDDGNREEKIISKFLLASLSTVLINSDSNDEGFVDRLKAYLTGDINADIQSMVGPAPQLTHLKLLLKEDCELLHRQLDCLMGRVDILQSLFERAGGAKEVGKRSSLSQRRRSRAGETDFDTLGIKLRECSDSVQSLETTSFQMLRELSAGITGQARPAGSLGQVATLTNSVTMPTSGEQEDEDEVVFETKTEGIYGKKYTITVNLTEGKLTFKKQGESHSSSYSHQQVLQLVKSRSKEQRLGILLAGQSRKDHNFSGMQAREHFCQLIQLIRNRMKAGTGMDQDSVSIFVGTWNMGDQGPPGDISSWFRSVGKGKTLPHALAQAHDIYAIGAQECSEKEWLSKIRSTLKMLHNVEYEKVASQTLWGIRLIILVKPEHTNKITHVQASQVRTGIGNALGNKGGVGISLFYGSVSLCFINCHLTSGNEKCSRRNQNYHDIVKGMSTLKHRRLNQFHLTNQFHHLFFFGDLNYRVDLGATEIVEFARKEDHVAIVKEDQLRKEMERKKIFVGFDEAPILFPPTYRFTRGRRSLDDYVWVKQKRSGIRLNVPSYCDRVLWCSYPGTVITNSSYGACTDIMTSDHSPLFASFQVGGVKQYVPEAGRGLGGENATFIIIGSLKAKIQTSSKTSFFMEAYSNCFEGVQRSSVNNDWIDTQAGYVWPVWCDREYVCKIPPIVTELEYLEQQHLLILLKSAESDESYAECCVSLRGLFAPKPVNVKKMLIHQGLEVGELDAYIHVTLDHYPKPEEDIYSDLNFITADDTCSSDLDGGRSRSMAQSFIHSTNGIPRTNSMSDRPMLPAPRSGTHSAFTSSLSTSSSSPSSRSSQPLPPPPADRTSHTTASVSNPPPPLPKRRDTSHRAMPPQPHTKQDSSHQQLAPVPVRKSESVSVSGRQEVLCHQQAALSSSLDATSRLRGTPPSSTSTAFTGSIHNGPPPPGGNPPVPTKRNLSFHKTSSTAVDGPIVPPRHSSRDRLDLPPPLPPKSPEPGSLSSHTRASDTHRKLSTVEELLAIHGLSQYTQQLVNNGYDDIRFIADITEEELLEIGVTISSERTRLLKIFSAYAS